MEENQTVDDAPPPSYDSIAADPPPTYDSIFGELRNARAESSGTADFIKKVIFVILSTIGCTICLGLSIALPVACIVIGVKYKNDCPRQRLIPIYLIVMGAFGTVRHFLGMHSQCKRRNQQNDGDSSDEANKKTFLERLIDCFLVAWFIAGNVWIYSIYEPSYNKFTDPLDYCDETLYLFSFWLMTASYICIALLCCCMCCMACTAAFSDD